MEAHSGAFRHDPYFAFDNAHLFGAISRDVLVVDVVPIQNVLKFVRAEVRTTV